MIEQEDTARELGNHPADGKPVTVRKGRYGPYVKHGGTNATLPRGVEIDAITLDEAVKLLEVKAAKGNGGKGRKGGGRRPEERRVGKECVRTGNSRGTPYH